MENYINEIAEICKLPFGEIFQDFKVVQLGDRVIYVCNFKKVIDFRIDRVILKVKNNVLEILGDNLNLVLINKKEVVIKGKINSFGIGVVNEK